MEKHHRIPSHAAPAPLPARRLSLMPQIDTTTYRRDLKWGVGDGCNPRPSGVSPSSIVCHTTNGAKGSRFESEALFLRDNHPVDPDRRVSSHYLIGKQGQIVQIVPDYLAAWHAGSTIPGFANAQSIGIEHHITPGENWTSAMREASTWLTRLLISRHAISLEKIETHRKVAVPAGRKIDPSGMTDATFYAWRASLLPVGSHQVIGVRPSIPFARFHDLLIRRKAPFDADYFIVIAHRLYDLCAWLDIDPAFWIALWTREQFVGGQLGNSEIGQATRNPLNIKAYGRTDKVTIRGTEWERFESWQIGSMQSIIHIKRRYGEKSLLHVETIVPVLAPETNGNDPAAYIAAVNADMKAMQS